MRVRVFFFNDTATTEIYTLSLHDALPISSPLRLEVCLDHPEPFVHAPGDLDEDVVGILIVHALTLLDGASSELAERRQHRGESVDVLPAAPGLHGVFGQRRSLGDRTRCALDAPAQLDGALGDQIDVVL